ncbi:acyl-CoA thioesterase [Nocardia speluncae]|uniref:acyl-CoA thioesterase n=1 Tax=Nocardia speluncae TaxID=419477 RepID=UPI00082E6DBD|nr:thioesterase family protein [Nocardia speluncae]
MTGIDAPPHPFDTAIATEYLGGHRIAGRTCPDYANMVGPFGGVTAAALLRAIEGHPDRLGDPLALTVNYAGPIADGPFEITARPVRTNRTNQHWQLELSQDGAITTTATAVFGIRRDTWSDLELAMPSVPGPDQAEPQEFPEFIAWGRNYDLRFLTGAVPDPAPTEAQPASPDSVSTLWLRDRPARPLDFAALTAMSDAFYPRVFLRRGQYVPAGTISLTVYYHATSAELAAQGTEYLLGSARAHRFAHGHFDQNAHLWGHDGTLLATSHQLVYFKG